MARGAAVHGRRDDRAAVRRPFPGGVRDGLLRMLVPLGTFRFEDDAPPDKSKGELFPITIF